MSIQQQIDLENAKYEKAISVYRIPPKKPKDRIKKPLLKFLFMPKKKKEKIDQLSADEKEYQTYQSIIKTHEDNLRNLEYKRKRYEIYFKKKPKVEDAKSPDEPIFHWDHTKRYSWFKHPIKSLKKWQWRTFEKETIVLINMQLSNGKYISFIRPVDEDKFSIFGNTYIVDTKMARYSLSAGMNFLRYHQDLSIPLDPDIDVNFVKTAIESSGIIDCPAATNPSNITRFLNSNIIEQIFQGASLGKLLMIIIIIGIVCIITTIICTFILNGKLADVLKVIGK